MRRAAVKAISRTRNAALVGAVVAALREGHTNFSFLSSALQLLTLSGVDLTDALIELLRDRRSRPCGSRRRSHLEPSATPRRSTALIAALDDPAPNVQFHAIEALGTLASPAALDRLMRIAESGDFFLAFPAIEALVRINDPIVAARLVPLLPDPLLGGAAADALGQLGDENAIEPLVAALGAPEIPIVPVVVRDRGHPQTLRPVVRRRRGDRRSRQAGDLSPVGVAPDSRRVAHRPRDRRSAIW